HLNNDESLPVGGAHCEMAGWTRARSNHSGRKTRRARTCVVRGSARSRLAAAHAGREPGNPRPAGPCEGLLASAVATAAQTCWWGSVDSNHLPSRSFSLSAVLTRPSDLAS